MRKLSSIFFIATITIIFGCDDIFEEDIDDAVIQLTYPLDGATIESNVAHFAWENVEGATNYRIQVFSQQSQIVTDSLLSRNSFTQELLPGNYTWRVRAENSAYSSEYSNQRIFSLIETEDLTHKQVILVSPLNNFYTNTNSVLCNWNNLDQAENYTFKLYRGANGGNLIHESSVIQTSIVLNPEWLSSEGEYRWTVSATNEYSQTQTHSSRNILIDRSAPNVPELNQPQNNQTFPVSQNVNFSWSIEDYGIIQSSLEFTFEISNDEDFQNIIFTSSTNSRSVLRNFSNSGNYFWRVTANDAAGNVGSSSNSFKFKIE